MFAHRAYSAFRGGLVFTRVPVVLSSTVLGGVMFVYTVSYKGTELWTIGVDDDWCWAVLYV